MSAVNNAVQVFLTGLVGAVGGMLLVQCCSCLCCWKGSRGSWVTRELSQLFMATFNANLAPNLPKSLESWDSCLCNTEIWMFAEWTGSPGNAGEVMLWGPPPWRATRERCQALVTTHCPILVPCFQAWLPLMPLWWPPMPPGLQEEGRGFAEITYVRAAGIMAAEKAGLGLGFDDCGEIF